MHRILTIIAIFISISCAGFSQIFNDNINFTRQDSLRGSVTPERAWWDVVKYDITVQPDFTSKTIKGVNIITCKALEDGQRMQIDMQMPMEIISINSGNDALQLSRDSNVYYAGFPKLITKGATFTIAVTFQGKPREAVNPPWDGGWIWKRDNRGNPWMTVACQGLGASVWYPCKDWQGDEPDSATLNVIVPDTLVAVANGRLRSTTKNKNNTSTYTWAVANPISNYTIVPYIGKYVSWSEVYAGEKGNLDLSYWVLVQDEEKARKQFMQVPLMMKCFEHWFGPYPFYEDGYKLVESSHLGMEHQSAVAYGNKFQNGYLGHDLSGTGWGNKWDYIIVHESGHEWFGNNITTKDIADMWVHEGITSYSEVLFVDCQYGNKAGNEYCQGLRKHITNEKPVTGQYGVNKEGSTDMYPKGANLIHMIRQVINDDEKFRGILRGLNQTFYHQTVTSAQVESYISNHAGFDFSKLFDQYLRTTQIPTLEYKYDNNGISFRWANCIDGFDLPIKVTTDKEIWIQPGQNWKSLPSDKPINSVDRNFYINSRKM